ncbi:Uma2 family endonuclease [Actinoplanes bogorensis]|uniref:Uma2 family endonuclease n=1 Tax=Paractinoplanes bogorensis TaxID=1610840 RepID=A0ABS5YME0_9ACTN|nr:Uma2 family endonuclease [Actinoplanes bogorensis]MBU2664612.1 Uma2 family endonuclease [Actinoplanes bogorensis]
MHPGPWTEDEFFALGECINRVELLDGGLWVSPGPHMSHQAIAYRLHRLMEEAAGAAGLMVYRAINLRIQADTILIPDVVVVDDRVPPSICAEAGDTALVAEILSPSSTTMDRVTKRHIYAAARIDWYLLVDPGLPDYQEVKLTLCRRNGDSYVEAATAKGDEPLVFEQPFAVEIHPRPLSR